MKINKHILNIVAITCVGLSSCTKLNEKLNAELTPEQVSAGSVNTTALLKGVYTSMRNPYNGPWGNWSLQEFTTDEAMVPTRGGDWDDGGAWRALHLHKWDANHARINGNFKDLTGVTFAATDLLRYNPSASEAAQARFLRAFATYTLASGWNQVPYREPGDDVTKPSKVRSGKDAIDYVISEINTILPNLADGGNVPAYVANKDAAKMLLMNCYLNKGVYANRQAPTFSNDDLNKVVSLANEIIAGGKYQLSSNYFDNFAPNNDASKENIFTAQNIGSSEGGDVKGIWMATLHYNQNPSGWNGFCTLSNFYNKFESSDKRLGGSYTGVTNVSGIKVGFLIGQQYDQTGKALKDRKGNPLAFTKEVSIIEGDPNHLEVAGIRVIKYPIDYANSSSNANNDWVYYRYAGVLMMKAEALFRLNQVNDALTIVNQVRSVRGASALTTLTASTLLDELGREFFWEGHRREDLIRFGKFLEVWQEKPSDDPKYLIFPIPVRQLSVNSNLTQNPGY